MAGLVADYGSDDDDSNFTDSDEDYRPHSQRRNDFFEEEDIPGIATKASVSNGETSTIQIGKDSGVKGDISENVNPCSEDSDSDSDSEVESSEQIEEDSTQVRLPNPLLEHEVKPQHSVFSSEYDHQEQAKRSILEKHVKLTDEESEKRRNRPVCQSFLKGKCRYGPRCKFRHENLETVEHGASSHEDASSRVFQHKPVMLQSGHRLEYEPEVVDEDQYGSSQSRKRRHGVRDSLVPPKNALRQLQKQRIKDRPWTVNQ